MNGVGIFQPSVRPGPIEDRPLTLAANSLAGNSTGARAPIEAISVGAGLSLAGGELSVVAADVNYPEVANYAALPAAVDHSGETYVVMASQGTYFVNRKPAGFYFSDGATWTLIADIPDGYFVDSILQLSDEADPTKILKFELSGITGGQTRTLTAPDASGTLTLLTATQTLTNKTLTSPVLGGTLTGSGTIGGSTVINTSGSITGGAASFTTLSASGAITNTQGDIIVPSGTVGRHVQSGNNAYKVNIDGSDILAVNAYSVATLSQGLAVTGLITGGAVARIGYGYAGFAEMSHVDDFGAAGTYAFLSGGTGQDTFINAKTSRVIRLRNANNDVMTVGSAAVTVTGSLGATVNIWSGNDAFDLGSGTTDGAYFNPIGAVVLSRNAEASIWARRRSSDGTLANFYRDTAIVGTISVTTTSTAYNTSSDARLKTDLGAFDLSDVANPLFALPLRKYRWKAWERKESRLKFWKKSPASSNRFAYGVFAQEAEKVCPWMVNHDEENDSWSVNWTALFPNVIAGLQLHQTELDKAKQRISALEQEVALLKAAA